MSKNNWICLVCGKTNPVGVWHCEKCGAKRKRRGIHGISNREYTASPTAKKRRTEKEK